MADVSEEFSLLNEFLVRHVYDRRSEWVRAGLLSRSSKNEQIVHKNIWFKGDPPVFEGQIPLRVDDILDRGGIDPPDSLVHTVVILNASRNEVIIDQTDKVIFQQDNQPLVTEGEIFVHQKQFQRAFYKTFNELFQQKKGGFRMSRSVYRFRDICRGRFGWNPRNTPELA